MTRLSAALLALVLSVGRLNAAPAPAAPVAGDKAASVRLRLSPSTERHIRERHFPGGRQTRGKSVFLEGTDLKALLAMASDAAPRRQKNGRDKRVVDAGRVIGHDGRTGKAVRRFVLISEPDGLVITAYPGD